MVDAYNQLHLVLSESCDTWKKMEGEACRSGMDRWTTRVACQGPAVLVQAMAHRQAAGQTEAV